MTSTLKTPKCSASCSKERRDHSYFLKYFFKINFLFFLLFFFLSQRSPFQSEVVCTRAEVTLMKWLGSLRGDHHVCVGGAHSLRSSQGGLTDSVPKVSPPIPTSQVHPLLWSFLSRHSRHLLRHPETCSAPCLLFADRPPFNGSSMTQGALSTLCVQVVPAHGTVPHSLNIC